MALQAVAGLTKSWFTPEQEGVNDEEKTAFEIKPLNGLIAMEVLADSHNDAEGNLHLSGSAMQKALRHGLMGWRNFNDEAGKPIKFSMANFHRVPPLVLNSIVAEIVNTSQLSGEEEKN